VIPGTHANGYSDYAEVSNPGEQFFPAEILPAQMDESAAVDLVLDPGDISIHEAQIVHGSNANTSDTGRSAFAMRYFPTSVKIKENPDFSIYLARGEDLAGNHFADPGVS
jgi:ectoine hydroxylase-related dioxygenase (phytanoyl-CoA dioxygenase family)